MPEAGEVPQDSPLGGQQVANHARVQSLSLQAVKQGCRGESGKGGAGGVKGQGAADEGDGGEEGDGRVGELGVKGEHREERCSDLGQLGGKVMALLEDSSHQSSPLTHPPLAGAWMLPWPALG